MPYHVHNLNQLLLPPGAEYPGSLVIGEDGQLTTGYRMEFFEPWESGKTYYPQQTVLVDGWTMAANKKTTDYPAPTVIGAPFNPYQGTSPTTSGTHKQVVFGNRYTVNIAQQLVSYFVYTVIGQSYDVYIVVDPEGEKRITPLLSIPEATSNGWQKYNVSPVIIGPGQVFDLIATTTEPADTPVIVDATYNYTVPQNPVVPVSGEIIHSRSNSDAMNISYTDNDTIDRTALIQGLSIGDKIATGGVIWTVQSNLDNTTYATVGVSPAITGTAGIQTVTFETVVATPITYMADPGYWAGSGFTISGVISVDDTYENATINDSAYGTDVEVIELSISEDWDVVAPGDAAQAGEVVLTASDKDWVKANSTSLEYDSVITGNNQWTEIARFSIDLDKGVKATLTIDSRRTDAFGIYNAEYAALAFNNGGSLEFDGLMKFELGDKNLDVRADSDGTDLVFEVKGRNNQDWSWKMAVFFRDIN